MNGDLFFRLPTELCCLILRDWLLLGSVVRLDNAVCNVEKRSLLWNTIYASPQCILSQGSSYCFHERETFAWLCARNLSASGLYFTWDVDETVRQYFQSFGASIKKIEFHNCDVVAYLSLICMHCSNIVCVSFADVKYPISEGGLELLSRNLKALDLSGTSITDEILELITKRCPRITHLSVSGFLSISDDCGRIVGSNLRHLQWLDIANNDDLTDAMLITLAEHSHATLKSLHMEYTEGMYGFGLMELIKKCTKLSSLFITYHEDFFENFDFSLLCNLTELSICHQNETEEYLHSIPKYCKRLQRFRLYCDFLCDRKSNCFHLKELTRKRLPDLKVLAPFGVSKKELAHFRLIRPEVEIVLTHIEFDPCLFNMKW